MDRWVAVVVETIVSDDPTLLNLERHLTNEKPTVDGLFSRAWAMGSRNQKRGSREEIEHLLGSEGFRFVRLQNGIRKVPQAFFDHPIPIR
jgi:hypothetical protein